MNILAIESSCDETAAAIIKDGTEILSNIVVSQIDIFKAYGGVIPEVAARSHLEAILPVIHKAFEDAGFKDKNNEDDWLKIDAIAVTHTPGLLGSLLIGTLTARTLAILHNKPLYAVHHLKSHIYANWLETEAAQFCEDEKVNSKAKGDQEATSQSRLGAPAPVEPSRQRAVGVGCPHPAGDMARNVDSASCFLVDNSTPTFPLLSLVISGGHTQIIYMKEHNNFEIIGTTLDDAVGECFDKVAKILGLPYPGGPAISKAARGELENLENYSENPNFKDLKSPLKLTPGNPEKYTLPHPNIKGYDFSFSGLKTAVLRAVQKECNLPINHPSYDLKNHLTPEQIADFAASFENTAVDILLEKLKKAIKDHPETKSIVFAGGVSANDLLRKKSIGQFHEVIKVNSKTVPHEPYEASEESETRNGGLERTGSKNLPFITPDNSFCAREDGLANFNPVEQGSKNLSFSSPTVFFPKKSFSGDNAAMVGAAAYFEIKSGVTPTDPYSLDIYPRSKIS